MNFKNVRVSIITRLFVFNFLIFGLVNTIIIYGRRLFDSEFIHNYELMSFASIVLVSFLLSIITHSDYMYVNRATRMDNKDATERIVNDVLIRQGWKVELESEDQVVYKLLLMFGIWKESIRVKYSDTEFFITGPKKYINIFFTLAKFPYNSVPLNNLP